MSVIRFVPCEAIDHEFVHTVDFAALFFFIWNHRFTLGHGNWVHSFWTDTVHHLKWPRGRVTEL